MKRRAMLVFVPGVVVATAAFAFGGWAAITIDDLPDALTVGQPTSFAFTIRQHGNNLLEGLSPTIEARSGNMLTGDKVQVAARPGKTKGHYVASLTIPKAGEWRLTVKSGFGPSDSQLLPMQAVAAGASAPAITDAERGRRLFVAKGCVTCHVHNATETKTMVDVGSNLTDKRFDAAYLALYLANPSIRPPTNNVAPMPNLGLSPKEIASLSAFINQGRIASTNKE